MSISDWTIESLGQALRSQRIGIVEVAQTYIDRIHSYDAIGPNAIIRLNPDWHAQAQALQASLNDQSGAMHGIPILIKDNIDTVDLGNSAGSLALWSVPVAEDATLIQQLRQAGALILGKTNLSEWANFRSPESISGWSSAGGQTRNARSLEHSPSGSSSGSAAAIAADFAVAAIGTETDGSIVSPAAHHRLVGLKPTVGWVSRAGIIPIAWSQDTAGPMTKTVRDAALLFEQLVGADPLDPVTRKQPQRPKPFLSDCQRDFIVGKRIGVIPTGGQFPAGVAENQQYTVQRLERAGAICIDVPQLPAMVTLQAHEIIQMICEFPTGLADYLASRRPASPYRDLADLVQFNLDHRATVMPHFNQEWFDQCLLAPGPQSGRYREAQQAIELFRQEMTELWFARHNLDALVCACNGPAWRIDAPKGDRYTGGNSHIAAVPGWPSITVPAGTLNSLPLGALFIAPAWQEQTLLGIAYGFEQQA